MDMTINRLVDMDTSYSSIVASSTTYLKWLSTGQGLFTYVAEPSCLQAPTSLGFGDYNVLIVSMNKLVHLADGKKLIIYRSNP